MKNEFRALGLLIISALVIFNGCASFKGEQLTEIEKLQKPPQPLAKCVILDFKWTVNDEPVSGQLGDVITKWQKGLAEDIILESGLFEYISKTQQPLDEGDYELRYLVNNHGSKALAFISGFISGLTLTIIPGFAVDHWSLNAEVRDYRGTILWNKTYEDKMSTWIWFFLFPLSFSKKYQIGPVSESVVKNMYRHPLEDIYALKILKYPTEIQEEEDTPSFNRQSNLFRKELIDLPIYGGPKITLALTGLNARGVTKEEAESVAEILRRELFHTDYFSVADQATMEAVLKQQNIQLKECFDQVCAIELGKMLKVSNVAFGSLIMLGQKYFLEVSVADIETGKLIAAEGEGMECKLEQLPELARVVARKIALTFSQGGK